MHCDDFDYLPSDTDAALSSRSCWPAVVYVVIDATLDSDLLEEVVEASKALLHRLPPATLISLVAFDSAVTLFELVPVATDVEQLPDAVLPAQSWVLPGDARATAAMVQRLCASAGDLIAPVGACMHVACAALDALRTLHRLVRTRERPRCIGAALAAVLSVHGKRHACSACTCHAASCRAAA
jgi:hypothetical protein